jgi:hypothetical protein
MIELVKLCGTHIISHDPFSAARTWYGGILIRLVRTKTAPEAMISAGGKPIWAERLLNGFFAKEKHHSLSGSHSILSTSISVLPDAGKSR